MLSLIRKSNQLREKTSDKYDQFLPRVSSDKQIQT